MADNPDQKPRIIALDRYTLYANAPGSSGRRARLIWSVRNGYPRVTVFTNDPNDSDQKQMIIAALDPTTFMALMDLIAKAAQSKDECKFVIDCYTPVRDSENKIIDKSLTSYVVVGKDNSGVVWISVGADNRPKIKFNFTASNLSVFKHSDGSQLTEAEVSAMMAIATVKCLVPIVNILMEKSISEYSATRSQGGGGNTTSYGNKESSKPSTSRSNDFDDDIPY